MEGNKKILLVSFATTDLKRSIKRFETQAIKSKFYKKIYIFTPDNLPNQINQKLNSLIKKGKKRGYGYWYWKPLILMELMQRINDSDIIQYLDIGFHINNLSNSIRQQYIENMTSEELEMYVENLKQRGPDQIEKNYDKERETMNERDFRTFLVKDLMKTKNITRNQAKEIVFFLKAYEDYYKILYSYRFDFYTVVHCSTRQCSFKAFLQRH